MCACVRACVCVRACMYIWKGGGAQVADVGANHLVVFEFSLGRRHHISIAVCVRVCVCVRAIMCVCACVRVCIYGKGGRTGRRRRRHSSSCFRIVPWAPPPIIYSCVWVWVRPRVCVYIWRGAAHRSLTSAPLIWLFSNLPLGAATIYL